MTTAAKIANTAHAFGFTITTDGRDDMIQAVDQSGQVRVSAYFDGAKFYDGSTTKVNGSFTYHKTASALIASIGR